MISCHGIKFSKIIEKNFMNSDVPSALQIIMSIFQASLSALSSGINIFDGIISMLIMVDISKVTHDVL